MIARRIRTALALIPALAAPVLADAQSVATAPPAPFAVAPEAEARIADLLARMTLEEKLGQLTQFSGADATGPDNAKVDSGALASRGGLGSLLNVVGAAEINAIQRRAVEGSRLGIPILFSLDVIHGYHTVYPVPLAMSATWDPDLTEWCSRMAAVEASADGIRWTFAPMVDVARDDRWGRVTEGAGEDPYLGSVFAAAAVRGFQGADLSRPDAIAACAKHFAGYGAGLGGREYDATEISERAMREVHLPPFKAAVDAGVATLMSAFHSVNGVPATASRFLLTDVLRDEWGFRGFVVSDWTAIGELIPHGIALDSADAARKALHAGVDMDMVSNAFASQLPALVEAQRARLADIDVAVERVLRVKMALGLFEHPYTDESLAPGVFLTAEHRALAQSAAEASFVLLKNDPVGAAPILPLAPGARIALVGPLADSAADMLGAWAGRGKAEDVITLQAALAHRLGDRLTSARGCDILEPSTDGFAEAVAAARGADVVVMALGESRKLSGEASSRSELGLPGVQLDLLKAVIATGKPVVLVVFSGRPLALLWEAEHVPAILQAWFPGVNAGPALERTLFGEVSPAGRLTMSMPRSVGQMPLFYNTLNTGRPAEGREPGTWYFMGYKDQWPTPLYPFGHGLTYTTFAYAPTTVDAAEVSIDALRSGGALEVSTTITNTGVRTGVETAQLYINQRGTSVARPVRELKGFRRVALEPGESQRVSFSITQDDLAFWNLDMDFAVEPGELTVWIAPNAQAGEPATVRIVED